MENFWAIEMQGPAYLTVTHSGGYDFAWTDDVHKAIRFSLQEHADKVWREYRLHVPRQRLCNTVLVSALAKRAGAHERGADLRRLERRFSGKEQVNRER
jgi:hypothetical protein